MRSYVLIAVVAMLAAGNLRAQSTPASAAASVPAQVVVNRDSGKMGSLCVTELYIDGALVGRVAPGQSTTITAAAGAKELMAKPALDSYLCKKFYALPQWERRAPLSGQAASFRYGFTAKGEPFLEASR